MRLKEIKLAGFKSFVDPTTVTFPGNRCAVVGPNGCGKSNIIDAVRWVLGESSARQLRGEALTDVIFVGSEARQPISQASVELVFDNGDGRAGGEFAKGRFAGYSEIAVRRELTRDAQSAYYLNGTRCRRRDVADVFLGTGIGPRSYSIIEQGMVSQLVVAKPEELRTYLEEAAGISKYRERRRETQNRIKHTVDNLERLTERTDELGRHLAHLKRQAKAAERYREFKDQERRLSAELHALRLGMIGADLTAKESHIGTLGAEHERALAVRTDLDAGLERNRAAQAELNTELGAVQGRWHGAGADAARLEQGIEYNTERQARYKRDLEDLTTRHRDTKEQLDADSARIEHLNAKLAAKAPRLADSAADDRAAAARLADVEERLRRGQRAGEDHAGRLGDNNRETEVRQSRIEHGEKVLQSLRARAGALEAEPGSVVDPGVERLARQIEDAARRVDALRADLAANTEALTDAREERSLRERARDDARSEAQRLRAELASLEAVQRAAVGKTPDRSESGRWLREHGLSDAPRLGERLGVSPGWELAVEAVLGGFADAVAVDETGALANDLSSLKGGGVTLYEAVPSSTSELVLSCEGQGPRAPLPPLSALVDNAVGSLVDGVFAADSIDDALSHRSALGPGQSIVTRNGVWMGADWIRLGTTPDQDDGVVARAREIERLEAACKEADARFEERDKRLDETRDRLLILEEERETVQARYTDHAEELSRVTLEHDVRQVRMEEADARARRNAAERDEIRSQIEDETKLLADCRDRLTGLVEADAKLRAEGEALREIRDRETAELEQVRQDALATRDALHALRGEYQGMRASLTASETARQRLLDQRRDFDARIRELRAGIAEVESVIPGQRDDLRRKSAERRELEGRLAELRRRSEDVEVELREGTVQRADADAAVESVRSLLEEARVERERLVANRDNVRAQLAETGIDLVDAQRGLPADATKDAWVGSLTRLAARITRLGPINLAAIDEYDERSEEKRNLDAQREDLDAALATLRSAIRRIDHDTRTRFRDTFERVNENLQGLFPRIFGGGSARLVQTGEDWLDTGVALVARPPGKHPSVHQLSGGEKAMAAVALIFSIFQLNPSPVCLLDEVDAPLDDTNVVRFGDLIREMSGDVQFVVVTHNKQTIEMADHLLGVTMQEAGVSRLVSVDMEGAARMAAG
ncbi:MAG: chromosome segregation protein SMC [Gammaproteobacteria bacterium]|nr:chromosome segregation protein SMC [Gammaproteobacteria bacterium]